MESESAPGDTGLPRSTSDENGVAEALGRLCDMAALRRPDDPLLVRFLPLYYSELPAGDVDDRKLDDIYAVAVLHLSLAGSERPARRSCGWCLRIVSATGGTRSTPCSSSSPTTCRSSSTRRAWCSSAWVSASTCWCTRCSRSSATRRTGSPTWRRTSPTSRGLVEAWTQIEIDRTDEATAKELERAILAAVEDVRRVVEGFPAMRQRMEELGDVDPILPWFAAGQFVFLGSADYDVADDGTIRLRPGSELGLARDEPRFANPRPMPRDRPVMIARTDATARVFRADRQAVIAVTSDGGRTHTRFVGLLATNAYRVSVLEIPGVGEAVADALDLSEARMHSHTGRATRTVLENLPRDLVLEQEPTAVARLVAAIVGLQERQLVRVFEVPEPVGPWTTVLVYLPRNRFTAELPERIADAVATAYGADQRTFEPYLGASSLARIAVSVRRPGGVEPVDLDAIERLVDELSTSWSDRLRAALVADVGEEEARILFERVGSHAPPAYRAVVPPERADHDVRQIAALLDTDAGLSTSLGRDVDAPAGEWRFRVYRRGAPAALSELLPLLDHLGLQALDEQPYTFDLADERVFVYGIGVRVPADVDLDPARRTAVQDAFGALVAGTIESDGFNRLVLRAGLTAREVTIIRAYGKYLRQIGFAFSQALHRGHPGGAPAARRRSGDAVPHPLRPGEVRGDGRRRSRPLPPTSCGRGSSRPSTPSRASTTTASAASS